MIYDCFTFYNEKDLLSIRLHELYDVVDRFVLVEGNLTHSGKEKESEWLKIKEEFRDVSDKVIYHCADLTKFSSTKDRESGQRDAIKDALTAANLNDSDIVTICDLDEIPGRNIAELNPSPIIALEQRFCNYYLNNLTFTLDGKEKKWTLARACTWRYLRMSSPQNIRMLPVPIKLIHKCGWHFSFVGGEEQIKNKIDAYLHQEFNNTSILGSITNSLKENRDVLKRADRLYKVSEIELPEYVTKNINQFQHLIR